MLANYFKVTFRNLFRNKINTLIHIAGLALGLACFLLIREYVHFEKSYDDFHSQPKQLYRLTTDNVVDDQIQVRDAMSFAPSGKSLQEELPEVISYATTYKTWRMVFRKEDQPIEEKWVTAVDSNYLNLFNFQVIRGDKAEMLRDPYSIVFTESQAEKYFKNVNPIGREVFVLGSFNRPFEVTGVIKDIPQNTHYRFDILVSLSSFEQMILEDAWNGFNYYTYLLLDPRANHQLVEEKLPDLSRKFLGDNSRLEFNLQPVQEIHLHSDFTFEPEAHGSAKAVHFLNIISVLILLIAWINYINLSTARALERAKEVGLRKAVGASKSQLIFQFFLEALFINLIGAVAALLIAQLVTPYFNVLVGKPVLSEVWNNLTFLTGLLSFFSLGTLVTGFYPALVLSSFKPIGLLKGKFAHSKRGLILRKSLVTIQFAASLALIAASLIVYHQIEYMTGRDIGISVDQVVGIANPDYASEERERFVSNYKSFISELKNLENISQAGCINNLPGGGSADISSNSGGVRIIGMSDRVESTVYITGVDDQVQATLKIEILAGRNFDRDFAGDTASVIVNKSLLTLLNITMWNRF